MTRARSNLRTRGEQGSTLVFVLCMIVVVAVAGAAVLKQQSGATNVQGAYESVRTQDDKLDGFADQTIQQVRLDPLTGVDATGVTGATNPCNDPTSWQTISTPTASNPYTILCQPLPGSGRPENAAPNPPDSAIKVLGGQLQVPGNDRSVASDPGGWDPNPNKNPFCDNWHAFQTSSGGICEAGLFVGRATDGTDDDDGGLVIGSSNALNPDPRGEVLSNGAIVAGYKGANPRSLDVQGGIWARAGCGAYHDAAHPWVANAIRPNYNGAAGSKTCQQDCKRTPLSTTDEFCWQNPTWPAPLDETSAANTLMADPDWVHEPIAMDNVCNDVRVPNCVPKVDNQSWPAVLNLSPSALCGTATGGIAVMPANQVGTFPSGEKAYAAIYDSAADLNALMQSATCKDTLFWFRPGVYYFDFTDKDGSTAWQAPFGCIPAQSNCIAGQIIGGSPDRWDPCTGTDWNSTPSVMSVPGTGKRCVQPSKIMYPDKNTFGSAGHWVAPCTDGTPGMCDTTDNVDFLDHRYADISLYQGGDGVDFAQQEGFVSPIPLRPETVITELKAEIGYSMPSAANLYKDAQTNTQGGYLDIDIAGVGDCYIHLPSDTTPNENDQLTQPSKDTPQEATGNNQVFDITNGCDPMDSRIHMSSGFPRPSDCAGANPNPATNPNCIWFHPEWVNMMKLSINTTASSLTNAGNQALLRVDGMQLRAAWKGRPAPQYPDGCSISDPGVQFIFGGTSRIAWGQGSSEDAMAELCASKASLFPTPESWKGKANPNQYPDSTWGYDLSTVDNLVCKPDPPPASCGGVHAPLVNNVDYVTGNGSDKGIAIYGVSDDNAPRELSLNTASATIPYWGGTPVAIAPTFDQSHSSGLPLSAPNPVWQSTSSPTGNPDFNDVKAGDGKVATAQWPITSNNTADLAFKMPDLSAAPYNVPVQSTITNVSVTVEHREGDYNAAGTVFTPGGLLQGTTPNIANVSLRINPSTPGQKGANGYVTSPWDSITNSAVPVNRSLPVCDSYTSPNNNNPLYHGNARSQTNPPQPLPNCRFTWGTQSATYQTNPVATCNAGDSACYKNPPWNWQRDLTDKMSTVEGWSNAWFQWEVTAHGDSSGNPGNACAGCTHFAAVDRIYISIKYRPFGKQLRPLRGCLSTRTAWLPATIVGQDPYLGNPSVAAVGHDWLDSDWGWDGPSGGAPSTKSDKAFGNVGDGTMAGNGGPTSPDEQNDCPLVDIANNKGRVKFHVQGSIYAPSAAISLSGNANDAQWATQNITARQVTALRQKNPKGIPGIGDEDVPRDPRKVRILVCDQVSTPLSSSGCDPGHELVNTVIQITDLPDVPGFQQDTLSWKRSTF